MFSLFHKPDSAQATLAADETACEAQQCCRRFPASGGGNLTATGKADAAEIGRE